ncbi:predicted protein [Naegleria gruberi]|uniref:Predicted protein n=1 Tax=Naegleria gruberi TaxID=5762 RepID=D2W2S8_NAEGR|nr:uncharacterized protein NAEGRDRAFT_54262 [Naegleria gruberi]EFC36603.1 predicted protein [Naegleria gruberi]|eukprot:XP_002669347.1 predicted protein [Naegleria gruberi strain NEG-M]
MKKIYILRGLLGLLVIVGVLQFSHLWWIPLMKALSTRLKESTTTTLNNLRLVLVDSVGKSYDQPHQEVSNDDEIIREDGDETVSSLYKNLKLPTIDANSESYTQLVPLVPTPFPVESVYNSSKYSKLENMQQSECWSFTEDIMYSQPLERRGVIQIPASVTSKDMLNLWKDFSPSEVRAVLTPNMIELSDDKTIQGKMHLAPIIENSHIQETDLEEFYRENYPMFKVMSTISDAMDTTLDRWKRDMNEKHFVLNAHKFNENQKEDHLPIWMRAYQRTTPLNQVLKALCQVTNIEETILIVTIDGDKFLPVIEELLKYDCVKMRIYFHSFKHTSQNFVKDKKLYAKAIIKQSFKLFAHASYGLYLCLIKFKYPYVITIEDDIKPLPDFYNYHRSLYRLTLSEKSPFLSVLVSPGGINLICNFVNTLLHDAGIIENMPYDSMGLKHQVCSVDDVDHVVPEVYHTIWGSGISYRLFRRMWFTWFRLPNRFDFFLGTMMRDLRKKNERNIIPCSPRVQQIANAGMNGGFTRNARIWEILGPYATKRQSEDVVKQWSCRKRQYTMLVTDGFVTDYLES